MALKAVLEAFEQGGRALSLGQLARQLEIDQSALEGMILFWVHKGRLREVGGAPACSACGTRHGCPLVVSMPRRYELVTGASAEPDTCPAEPPCRCCG